MRLNSIEEDKEGDVNLPHSHRKRVKTSGQLLLLISLNKGKLIEASMQGLAVIEIIFPDMDYCG